MLPVVWHLLILLMQVVHCPRMSTADYSYVSKFKYVSRLHPTRNPDCVSQFAENRQIHDQFDALHQPSIEVRAVFAPCTELSEEKAFEASDDRFKNRNQDGKSSQKIMDNCTKKIFISMKFTNVGKIDMQEKFVVIDHALDPITLKKIPLENPYVIKVRQEGILQLYGLKFQSSSQNLEGKLIDLTILNKVVNAEAREEVINNETPNYAGCNVDNVNPTCGQTFLHDKPVRFSQGFCCSCDAILNANRQYGLSNDSLRNFRDEAKSNYNGNTNEPSNKLRTDTEYRSLDDNKMAERQIWVNDVRPKKEDSNGNANLNRNQIIASDVSVSDTCQKRVAGNEAINTIQAKEPCGYKGTEKSNERCLSMTGEVSSSPVTNSISREKYSRKLADTSSTSVSPLSPKVTAERPPSGDKIVSIIAVRRDRASARKNDVLQKETGRAGDKADRQKVKKDVAGREDRSKQRANVKVAESENSDSKRETHNAKSGKQKFYSVVSSPKVQKSLQKEEARLKGSPRNKKAEERANQSPSVTRLADPLSPAKYVSTKKSATGKRSEKAVSSEDAKKTWRKGCSECRHPGSLHGNGDPAAKSSKKRNKVFPGASAIDSPAIPPAMHLNEPLKNLPTGVLNSNRSPPAWKPSRRGNLNRVMESTSPLSDIIARSFNEKHEANSYPGSKGNEGNEVLAGGVKGKKLLSETLDSSGNLFLENDSFGHAKKLINEEIIKNYTPQKRTLKDLSYKHHDLRDIRSLGKQNARGSVRKRNFRRSRRHLRSRRNLRRRRRSKLSDGLTSRRSRRKMAKKIIDNEVTMRPHQHPGLVRVYLDNTRILQGRAQNESKSNELAHSSENSKAPEMADEKEQSSEDSNLPNEANGPDSVDKQIEEKFSRISDALKEDSMERQVLSTTEVGRTDNHPERQTKSSFVFDENPRDKFKKFDQPSSGAQNNEKVADEKVAGSDNKENSDQSIKQYKELNPDGDIYLESNMNNEDSEQFLKSAGKQTESSVVFGAKPQDTFNKLNEPFSGVQNNETPDGNVEATGLVVDEKATGLDNKENSDQSIKENKELNPDGDIYLESKKNNENSEQFSMSAGNQTENSFASGAEPLDKFNPFNESSSGVQNNETPGVNEEVTDLIVNENAAGFDNTENSDQWNNGYKELNPDGDFYLESKKNNENSEQFAMSAGKQTENSFVSGAEPLDKFNQFNESSSDVQNNETPGENEVAIDWVADEKAGGFDNKENSDLSMKENKELNPDGDIYLESKKDKEDSEQFLKSLGNSKFDDSVDSSLSANSDLVVSPMIESLNDQAGFVTTEEIEKAARDAVADDRGLINEPQWTTGATSMETEALIVIDVFKIANGTVQELSLTTAPEDSGIISQAFKDQESLIRPSKDLSRQPSEFQPVREPMHIVKAATPLVMESPRTTDVPPTIGKTTIETTINQPTTITDETFRPLSKPSDKASTSSGGAEFHNEISIEESTYPDETDGPSSTDAMVVNKNFVVPESIPNYQQDGTKLRLGFPGRKKKRTPTMIKNKDLLINQGPVSRRNDRSLNSGNIRNYGRRKDSSQSDSAVQFSLEAGNVNLVKQKMGVTRSYIRERRKYVEVTVDEDDKLGGSKEAKFPARDYGCRKGYERNEVKFGNRDRGVSKDTVRSIHPWVPTAKRFRSPPQSADDIPGRILPPCTRNRARRVEDFGAKDRCEANVNQRHRRLLSVQSFKRVKRVPGRESSDDGKKMHDDEGDFVMDSDEDTEEKKTPTERRKRMKSVHEKPKKREPALPALKRKSSKKNKNKKHSISSPVDSLENYDYLLPEEQADVPDNSEDFLKNDEGESVPEDTVGKDTDEGSKISEQPWDNEYNQLIGNPNAASFDKIPVDLQAESQSAIDEDRPDSAYIRNERDEQAGKDFEISLTGKIHLESDSNGRPVSISFNAEPEFSREDSIADEKASYANRFPSESANSFIDASDTLAGTDNANFVPLDDYDVQPSPDASLDSIDDQSNLEDYYHDPIRRSSAGNAELYEGVEPEDYRQRLLQLRKKSVGNGINLTKRDTKSLQDGSKVDRKGNGCRKKPEYLNNNPKLSELNEEANLVSKDAKVEDGSRDVDQGESLNLEDPNLLIPSNDDSLSSSKKTSLESLTSSAESPVALNMPENPLANSEVDANSLLQEASPTTANSDSGSSAPNITTQRIDYTETTTIGEKLGDQGNTTIDIYQRGDVISYSNYSDTMGEQFDRVITTIAYGTSSETADQVTAESPKFEEAIQSSSAFKERDLEGQNTQSIEKQNMLAVEEFVKKLEDLVTDAGNSSNKNSRNLIHLKKFIIVPDNRTLRKVKEFAAQNMLQETTPAEEILMMRDGTVLYKDAKTSAEDVEQPEQSVNQLDQEAQLDDPNLIKDIIASVIRGDDSKREARFKNSDAPNSPKLLDDQRINVKPSCDVGDSSKDRTGNQGHETCLGVGANCENSVKQQEEISAEKYRSLQNSSNDPSDRFLGTNLETAKNPSRQDIVRTENKFNVKEKREASPDNANSTSYKGENENDDKRKSASHAKKKRRKKKKRKMKKKSGKKREKHNKKTKSIWPFKRNLLMIPEREQIETINEKYGIQWKLGILPYKKYNGKVGASGNFKRKNRFEGPQVRGGQDCDNRQPSNTDSMKYMESAHCLRFSDSWYSVYQLEDPLIHHNVHIEIYQKYNSMDGSISWKDLTNGSAIRLGIFDRHHRNPENTVILSYSEIKSMSNIEFNLDPVNDRLLMPSTLTQERSKNPETKEGSDEYLVVRADKINGDGNECDKAGVGFTAFAGQPDRCGHVRGTCLKNQPLAYWRHDMEARDSGRAGCYFLSNFARVPSEAIKYNVNGTGSREFLALEYHSPHVSVIDVELRVDYNAFLGAGLPGRLTALHADNTAIDYTAITVLITNTASSSSSYRARITDCPKGLPAAWRNVESPMTTIPPSHDRKITLDIFGRLSLEEFSCSVELLNHDGALVATRQIKVRKMDRCSCVNHCACSCVGNARGISCQPMSLENYHAAGFLGSIPTTPVKQSLIRRDTITIVLLFFTVFMVFLLLLGILKWLIGLCFPTVSRRGLDILLGTNEMRRYYEKSLRSRTLTFNSCGEPVHPDTGRKSVRICNRKLEFFLNVIFFFLYPFAICFSIGSKPYKSCQNQLNIFTESKTSVVCEKEEEVPTMVSLSTYGDTTNSRLEAEDTQYVIEELKKSQESLQKQSRRKSNRDIVGEHTSSD